MSSLSTLTGSKTRLKYFIYIICLREGRQLFIFFVVVEFLKCSRSRFCFFMSGYITATFSEFGTYPEDRKPFIMLNIGGPSTGSSYFSSLVGIGSSQYAA